MFFILLCIDIVLYLSCIGLFIGGLPTLSIIVLILALMSSWCIDMLYGKKSGKNVYSGNEEGTSTVAKEGVLAGGAVVTGLAVAEAVNSNNKAKNEDKSGFFSDCSNCGGADCAPTDCGGADCGGADCGGIDHPVGLLLIPVIALVMGIFYIIALIFKESASEITKKKPFASKAEKKAKKQEEQDNDTEVVDVESTDVPTESESSDTDKSDSSL